MRHDPGRHRPHPADAGYEDAAGRAARRWPRSACERGWRWGRHSVVHGCWAGACVARSALVCPGAGRGGPVAGAAVRAESPAWWAEVRGAGRQWLVPALSSPCPPGLSPEHTTLAIGCGADRSVPVDALPELAESLATRHNLATMISRLRTTHADLTTPAHHEPPVPIGFTPGPDAVADRGLGHARRVFAETAPTRLGPAARPALCARRRNRARRLERLQQVNDRLSGARPPRRHA
ncbi:DUF6177 family protein [Streptomyces sp. NPDC057557]|uniref:DUF6177 family protein n=1 Tax=Streptomyces sp. NPDC057557 TaxID=3346167 RepID=UPI0036A79EA1